MTQIAEPRRAALLRGSFRQALVLTGVVTLGALAAMALILAISLRQADNFLDRLARSQDQLAQVTRIEADINRLRADVAAGVGDAAPTAQAIRGSLVAYERSVLAEGRRLGPEEASRQDAEVATAERLTRTFDTFRAQLLAADVARADATRRVFEDQARQVVAAERREAGQAIAAMRRLRQTITLLGVAIPTLVAMAGVAAAWLMLARMLRPLRVLEGAAEQAGRGERMSPVALDGFAEFQELAAAFNRMDEQIADQRAALSASNRGLEVQVAERTAEIEASRAALAQADRTRRLFFSKLGHELRTPATVIRGEAEVALRDRKASPARLREALEHVVANGSFLQRRLEDMLALARAEDGQIALRSQPVDLAAVVREAVTLAEPYVRSSGLSLAAEVPDGPGPMLEGDASWLQQALLALVDNAAKFAEGGQAIRFSLARDAAGARIVVADSGPGVEAADLPFLFDSHYQTPAGRARGGSGLGLAIARWVVEQHGGAIAAQSPPGEGLTVEIRLPVRA